MSRRWAATGCPRTRRSCAPGCSSCARVWCRAGPGARARHTSRGRGHARQGEPRARERRSRQGAAHDILGILRLVLFAPEDPTLVKDDPDGRRRFLDDLLVPPCVPGSPAPCRTTSGCCGSGRRCWRPRVQRCAAAAGRPTCARSTSGTPRLAQTGAEVCRGAPGLVAPSRPRRRVVRAGQRRSGSGHHVPREPRRGPWPTTVRPSSRGRRTCPGRCAAHVSARECEPGRGAGSSRPWAGSGPRRSEAVCLVGPTATTSSTHARRPPR